MWIVPAHVILTGFYCLNASKICLQIHKWTKTAKIVKRNKLLIFNDQWVKRKKSMSLTGKILAYKEHSVHVWIFGALRDNAPADVIVMSPRVISSTLETKNYAENKLCSSLFSLTQDNEKKMSVSSMKQKAISSIYSDCLSEISSTPPCIQDLDNSTSS